MKLTKSDFCMAAQCPKMLWLDKFRREKFNEDSVNQSALDSGGEVGALARGIFGEYALVNYSPNETEMLAATAKLMDECVPVIAEATFAYNDLLCRVDVLKNLSGKEVELYEVKSSAEIKDSYWDDVAFQYYVLTKLGYHVKKACLVYVNNKYVRKGEIDLSQMFATLDMTDFAIKKEQKVHDLIENIRAYLKQDVEPKYDIDLQCFGKKVKKDKIGIKLPKKKSEKSTQCGFFDYCIEHLPQPNIFSVKGLQKNSMIKHYKNGIISFPQIMDAGVLTEKKQIQVDHELLSLPPNIDLTEIKAFLQRLSYPLYFLDFESTNPAIPMYDDSSPYQQIPFQYSLHILESEGGELQHKEYLAYPGYDPRRELAERLVKDIPFGACTIAYHMSFEKGRISELAELFPDLADHLMSIHQNMVDLETPFSQKHYYVREFQGSSSIKYVLPALFPNDPDLNYHNLEGIHNGKEALEAIKHMEKMTTGELEICRKNLLAYCKLDTFAMVKIWQRLCEVVAED